ncbi:hypothetical protein LSAT2_021132 [Lamellibrachia satsuma]|nr:hypothetical protein LSAT2_021132 [Lamellibrachia satsuma]
MQLPESETKLTWSPSPTPNGVITKYKVIVRDGTKIVKQVLTDGTERIMLLQNLDGYKTYSITVAAVNKVGVSDESRPITFQTPIRAAAKIGVDQIEVEPYTTTEAMEYMIRDEGNDIVIDVKNDTVLANTTKTLIRVSCGGQPKLVDVRVRAVTTVTGRRHLAEFSDWKRAIMCKDPGIHFIYIPPPRARVCGGVTPCSDGSAQQRTAAGRRGAVQRGAVRCSRRHVCAVTNQMSDYCLRCLCRCPQLSLCP